ncbi:hypothetical protein MKX03_035209 [Papaver bracteatum]|nr:hypothetical protein MKX03_035209 [Papaver bracteatum]
MVVVQGIFWFGPFVGAAFAAIYHQFVLRGGAARAYGSIRRQMRDREKSEKSADQVRRGFNCGKLLGFGELGGPSLSTVDGYSFHSGYLAKIAEMRFVQVYHPCIMFSYVRKTIIYLLCYGEIFK